MQFCIKPSDIYRNESQTSLSAYLQKHNIQIIDFRPRKAGDLFIACVRGYFRNVLECISAASTDIRYIVKKNSTPILPKNLSATITTFQLYYKETPDSLKTYLSNNNLSLLDFRIPKIGDTVISPIGGTFANHGTVKYFIDKAIVGPHLIVVDSSSISNTWE